MVIRRGNRVNVFIVVRGFVFYILMIHSSLSSFKLDDYSLIFERVSD